MEREALMFYTVIPLVIKWFRLKGQNVLNEELNEIEVALRTVPEEVILNVVHHFHDDMTTKSNDRIPEGLYAEFVKLFSTETPNE